MLVKLPIKYGIKHNEHDRLVQLSATVCVKSVMQIDDALMENSKVPQSHLEEIYKRRVGIQLYLHLYGPVIERLVHIREAVVSSNGYVGDMGVIQELLKLEKDIEIGRASCRERV